MRILIVDDDSAIRESLKATLENESFAVDMAADGQRGSFMARTNEYDLVILDNMLPLKTGIEVCEEIRKCGKSMPILLLSVVGSTHEKVSLLNSGVDDYVTKPYSSLELVARIKSLARRSPHLHSTKLFVGDLFLDCLTSEVKRGNKDIYLTRKEFALLELLLKNKGNIVSRSTILEHVWDVEGDPLSKTVETHIVNLRKKIGRGKKNLILNIHGRGYKIEG